MFAGGSGVFPWQDILAGLIGGSVWRVNLAHSFGGFSQAMKRHAVEQKRNRKVMKCIMVNL
jgi:hypothetical protein